MAISQAQRDAVANARKQLEEQRKRAQEAQENLRKQREKLPERQSQKALRQTYAGLKGREMRRKIQGAEQQIEGQRQQVTQYEKETLDPYEKQVKSAEGQISEYDRQVAAMELARKFYGRKVPYGFVEDDLVRNYLKEMYTQASLQKEGQQRLLDNPELLQEKIDILTSRGLTENQALATLGFKKIETPPEVTTLQLENSQISSNQTTIPESKGFIQKTKDLFLGNTQGTGEIYNPALGGYVASSQAFGSGSQQTSIIRSITPQEQQVMENKDLQGKAILAVVPQYLGTSLNKQYTEELSGKMNTTLGFLNPANQYDLARFNEQLKRDSYEAERLNKRLEQAEKDYNSGNITAQQYNSVINMYNQNAAIQRLRDNPSMTPFQGLAQSDLTSKQKFGIAATARVAQTLPYFTPLGRVVLGADTAREGFSTLELADTKQEKVMGGVQIGLGLGLAASGFARGGGGAKVTGTPGQLQVFKAATYGSGITLAGGLATVDYFSTLSQTGDKSVALGAAVGTGGTLLGGMFAPKVYEKTSDWLRTRNLKELRTPQLGSKPFIRQTRGGDKQLVFYERSQEVKLWKPSTYKYRGTKPGQFFRREYRIIDPLVEGRTQGLKEVTYYTVRNGRVVKVTEGTTSFPFDNPNNQLKWFEGQQQGVQQYYIPKKFSQPGANQGFGFSASPTKWLEDGSLDAYQTYYSGKGVSAYFFRTGNTEGSSVQFGGAVDANGKPVLYGSYFEKIKLNPGIREIKVQNPIDPSGKPWKQYVLSQSTQQGVLNLPLYKREVEGVVAGSRTGLGSGYYFRFSGRNIPIEEGIYTLGGSGSSLPSGTSTGGSSYIPSGSYVPSPTISLISLSSTSSASILSKTPTSSTSSNTSNIKIFSSPVSSTLSKTSSSSLSFPKSSSKLTSKVSNPLSSKPSSRPTSVSKPYSPISQPPSKTSTSPPPKKRGIFRQVAKKIEDEGFFEVFSKRFGKEMSIGKAKTQKAAENILDKYLRGTLAASGSIAKGGQKLKVEELELFKQGKEYRKSKSKTPDPFKLIQKEQYRLKKADTQVQEIKYFQRKAPKKTKSKKKSSGFFDWV